MGNRYTEKANSEQSQASNEELLLQIMQQEYPNDPLFTNGELSQAEATKTPNGTGKKKSTIRLKNDTVRNDQGILNIHSVFEHKKPDIIPDGARWSKSKNMLVHKGPERKPFNPPGDLGTETLVPQYTKYRLDKSFPTVDEDELDEIIDEEWEYFEDPDDEELVEIIPKGESGIFIVNRPWELRDIHDLYIQEGPELILQLDEGDLDDINDLFCAFYTDDGVAYPIPNYKTLEVMLVEKGLTYSAVREATEEQFKQFDLIFDGKNSLLESDDDAYGGDEDTTAVDEFRDRLGKGIVRDRSAEWNISIRFRSEYEPKAPFKRDPGDYIKPVAIRGKNISEGTLGPRIDLYQQEDLNDIYFDMAFMGQTTREKLREQYEGKMIILDWPTGDRYDSSAVTRDTDVSYDDAVFGLRMMINGHWKQVTSGFVMRLYAEINPQFLDDKGKMALTQYQEGQGRYGVRGLINLLVKAGAITVINLAGDTSITSDDGRSDPLWSLFSHIVEADGADIFSDEQAAAEAGIRPDGRAGLDRREYVEYLDNYQNGGNPFRIPELEKYEPQGSIAYYDKDQYRSLVEEAIYQDQIDTIKDDILEIFPGVAALVQETRALYNTLPQNYNKYVTDMLGAKSPMYRIMLSDRPWNFIKKVRKKLKKKDDRYNIFKLYMKNRRLRWDLSESQENKIVSNGGRHWMKTIARDKFADKIVRFSGISAGVMFAINPLAGLAAWSIHRLTKHVNVFVGSVPHGKTDKLPPWRFMDDNWYLKACIAERWIDEVEEMYHRGEEIDNNWDVITNYLDKAEGIVEEFDNKLIDATNLEDFQDLLDSLKEIESTITDDEVLDLIDRANDIRQDTDRYLKQALKAQYRAIEYMRERVHNGIGRRKKFGLGWPSSVQRIMNKYVYGESLKFNRYLPKKP